MQSPWQTCRASWGASQNQPLRLSQSDVAAICERCDTEAAAVANVLIGILDLSITDVDLSLLALFILVVAQLTLPLEAGLVLNTLLNEALDHVTSMHVNGTEGDELLAVVFGQLAVDDGDEVCKLQDLLVKDSLHAPEQL